MPFHLQKLLCLLERKVMMTMKYDLFGVENGISPVILDSSDCIEDKLALDLLSVSNAVALSSCANPNSITPYVTTRYFLLFVSIFSPCACMSFICSQKHCPTGHVYAISVVVW